MKKFIIALGALISVAFSALMIFCIVVLVVFFGPTKSFDELDQGETLYIRDVDVYKISDNISLENNLRIDSDEDCVVILENDDGLYETLLEGDFLKFYYNPEELVVYNREKDAVNVYLLDIKDEKVIKKYSVDDFSKTFDLSSFTEEIISDSVVN